MDDLKSRLSFKIQNIEQCALKTDDLIKVSKL